MSIFRCSKCGCVENTATSNYWTRDGKPPLCSECDPEIKKWHGVFKKKSAIGYMEGTDGFLYNKEEIKRDNPYYKNLNFKEVL